MGLVPYHEATTTVPSVATASIAACNAAPEPLTSTATSTPTSTGEIHDAPVRAFGPESSVSASGERQLPAPLQGVDD